MVGTAPLRIGFLGPTGTFTEEALLTQADYARAELVELASLAEVLDATGRGDIDLGFLPIENAIEGTVRDTLDSLVFESDLLIQREVELDIHLHLMARPGCSLDDVREVASMPVATAQCRKFLAATLPKATLVATTSTAEAARRVGTEGDALASGATAAIAPRLAADLYGLHILAEDVEDHPGNKTRFVAVATRGVPTPTGHDRTTIVCFQHADRPGSLHGIVGQFAARNINLTKVESRPTKRALGDYCFVFDLDGHVADEVVADCLRALHAEQADVKFLGSYPAAGEAGPARRREVGAAWREAEAWMDGIRSQIGHGGSSR
ncbi:MAG: prephenate dehydratase [Actinomycetota bacterium]|jgi:prephenate dehydratase|nr:prephenate dehydratase [Actinomycetota bacterium]MDA8293816.1 prephenate dehydratase [Actinomycetota bacterium]